MAHRWKVIHSFNKGTANVTVLSLKNLEFCSKRINYEQKLTPKTKVGPLPH